MKKFLFIVFTFLVFNQIYAQLDTKHWFAPMANAANNSYPFQKLYLSTNKTTPFEVRIYNDNIVIGKVNISKGNPGVFDIPRNLIITNHALFKPVKMGLYLEADYTYYANLRFSEYNHAEIITSKGTAGIGNLFYAVMAPISVNNSILNFTTSMLATEDNTTIKISKFKPNIIFSDGIKRSEFNITLNKGESYIIEGDGYQTINHTGFIGAKIEADKPISVTNGNFNGQYAGNYTNSSDILMDQSVPVDQLGNEFILIKGNGDIGYNMENAIVVGTKDNTEIYVNDETIPIKIINEGDFFIITDTKYKPQNNSQHYNLYIKTTEKVYVYQLLAGLNESSESSIATGGFNFIPALNCFLPKKIDEIGLINENYMYSNKNQSGILNIPTNLNIITERGAKITINGTAVSTNSGPYNLTGNTDWVTYTVKDVKGNISIESDKAITAGIIAGSDAAGYGGFFAGLPTKPTIVADSCFPNVILNVTPNIFETYQWYENGILIPGATASIYKATKLAYYSVEVTIGTCPPLTAEHKLTNCPTETTLEFKTCGQSINIVPKFTKSHQIIDLSSIKITEKPKKGKVIIDSITGNLTYIPNKGEDGEDEFQYKFCSTEEFGDCEIVTVKINLEKLIVQNKTITTCNINNEGIFDLSSTEITTYIGATKNYYPTYEDALNEILTNEIIDFKNYTSTNKKVFVLVKTTSGCKEIAEISLEFYPLPKLDFTKYQNEYCEETITINLENITSQVLSNYTLFTVKYYSTQADAIAGNTATLPNTNSFTKDTTIYMRIESENGCEPIIEVLSFKFGEKVKLKQEEVIFDNCDDDFDGIFTVNLASTKIYFTDSSTVTIKYFNTLTDAKQNINSINPLQEVNTNKTFYTRLEEEGFCLNFGKLIVNISVPIKSTLPNNIFICPNTTTTLDASSNYLLYDWSTGEKTQTIAVGTGEYWVDLTANTGCLYRHKVKVTDYQLPIIENITITNDEAVINVKNGNPPYKYSLDGINWQDSNIFTNLENGPYKVYVISVNNCEPITKQFTIFKIDNFITPNGDGKNDKWIIKLVGHQNVNIQIFDRYGKLIKQETINDEFIWDGKKNGSNVPSDSYWYRIQLNEKEIITGYLTVKNK
ncbi:T9SS type B sorting domain-containing protein [Algoriella sp.]|uniref:T9SS type B sorting domain-containing protein n=1 Tax=Algoriella sp. TaxID=1872434 RepID=UPI001B01B751|nr:T9SS type B sorting domain-containing protein [Algoriella sp.]MBO6213696.1 T9SS type B sorting domain-containing protein [Algoriella sp.]